MFFDVFCVRYLQCLCCLMALLPGPLAASIHNRLIHFPIQCSAWKKTKRHWIDRHSVYVSPCIKSCVSCVMFDVPYPDTQCMIYLPTFDYFCDFHVGKYTIHWVLGLNKLSTNTTMVLKHRVLDPGPTAMSLQSPCPCTAWVTFRTPSHFGNGYTAWGEVKLMLEDWKNMAVGICFFFFLFFEYITLIGWFSDWKHWAGTLIDWHRQCQGSGFGQVTFLRFEGFDPFWSFWEVNLWMQDVTCSIPVG